MAEAFDHQKPKERIISFSLQRREEIKEEIDKLKAEDKMHTDILKIVRRLVCKECDGEGHVMRPIPGCEIDGPRMHKCDACNGTGEPA